MQLRLNYLLITSITCFVIACSANSTRQNELNSSTAESLVIQKEPVDTVENFRSTDHEKIFEVPLGKTFNGFSYSMNGQLMLNGRPFSPVIKANPVYVTKFKISLSVSKEMAGAIAMDMDGQNYSYLLDLNKMTATPLQAADSWNAAQEIYWSPSTKYMVVFCSYEGEYFISINTDSKKIVTIDHLKPGTDFKTRWIVDSNPTWLGNNDILVFDVAEYCNPYEADCGESSNRILAKYKVKLDAATLEITKTE